MTTVTQREVLAVNDAQDSGNPMHDDEAARKLNFKGGLVPGVTVYGYLCHALVESFGEAWLDSGCVQLRLRQPVYAGEKVTVRAEDTNVEGERVIKLEALNPDGEVCALGAGSMAPIADIVGEVAGGALPKRLTLPDPMWPATPEFVKNVDTLGSIQLAFSAEEASRFVDILGDDHAIFRTEITHPAWLLRQANIIVDRNFDLGPWIHVSSAVQNVARVPLGQMLEFRAGITSCYTRKGKEYFDLDVVALLDGDPSRLAMRVMHRAIYRMPSP